MPRKPSAKTRSRTDKTRAPAGNRRIAFALAMADTAAGLGWSDAAFVDTAQRLTMTEAEAARLFPQGISEVVCCFSDHISDIMQKKMATTPHFSKFRTRDKVMHGVMLRFDLLHPMRESVRQLVWWAMRPFNAAVMLRQTWKIADVIWATAGDTATDYNRYTKRALLSGVLKATTLFWLQDDSANHAATRRFLEKQIDLILTVGKKLSAAKELKLDGFAGDLFERFMKRAA